MICRSRQSAMTCRIAKSPPKLFAGARRLVRRRSAKYVPEPRPVAERPQLASERRAMGLVLAVRHVHHARHPTDRIDAARQAATAAAPSDRRRVFVAIKRRVRWQRRLVQQPLAALVSARAVDDEDSRPVCSGRADVMTANVRVPRAAENEALNDARPAARTPCRCVWRRWWCVRTAGPQAGTRERLAIDPVTVSVAGVCRPLRLRLRRVARARSSARRPRVSRPVEI